MAEIMKVKCNGPAQHINAVDLTRALRPRVVFRGGPETPPPSPKRLVLPCRVCSEGTVVITAEMIRAFRQRQP